MTNLYMHTLDGKPAMYQPGSYVCFIGPYNRVSTKQIFKTSLKQIYTEQRASAELHRQSGGGPHYFKYGYIRIKVDDLPRSWWVTDKDRPADNQKVCGPFTTASDAAVAREYIERIAGDYTFWLEYLP